MADIIKNPYNRSKEELELLKQRRDELKNQPVPGEYDYQSTLEDTNTVGISTDEMGDNIHINVAGMSKSLPIFSIVNDKGVDYLKNSLFSSAIEIVENRSYGEFIGQGLRDVILDFNNKTLSGMFITFITGLNAQYLENNPKFTSKNLAQVKSKEYASRYYIIHQLTYSFTGSKPEKMIYDYGDRMPGKNPKDMGSPIGGKMGALHEYSMKGVIQGIEDFSIQFKVVHAHAIVAKDNEYVNLRATAKGKQIIAFTDLNSFLERYAAGFMDEQHSLLKNHLPQDIRNNIQQNIDEQDVLKERKEKDIDTAIRTKGFTPEKFNFTKNRSILHNTSVFKTLVPFTVENYLDRTMIEKAISDMQNSSQVQNRVQLKEEQDTYRQQEIEKGKRQPVTQESIPTTTVSADPIQDPNMKISETLDRIRKILE